MQVLRVFTIHKLSILLLIVAILLLIHLGCARPSDSINDYPYENFTEVTQDGKEIPVYMYAENCLNKEATSQDLSSYLADEYYADLLDAFGEEKLGLLGSYNEAYRLIWSRSFTNPVLLVFQKADKEMVVRWKVLSNSSDDITSEKIIASGEKILTLSDWEKLKQTVKNMEFWNLSTEDNNDLGVDGDTLLLEGRCEYKYHLVTRWSPNEMNGFRIGCNNMLRLAEAKIPNTIFK
jgi:hypothetical protein